MKYFLSILILFLLVSCEQEVYYKRVLSIDEKKHFSEYFTEGSVSYQGSPDNMMIIKESLILNPKNGAAQRELSVPYLKRGLGIKYEKENAKARIIEPDPWLGYAGYNAMYFYRDYKKAIELFDKQDMLTPDFIDYPQAQSIDLMRGLCHLKLNNLSHAKGLLKKYIDYETQTSGRDFVDARGFLYLGIVLMEEQKYDEANRVFEEGLLVDKNNAELLFQIAKSELALNNPKEASRTLDQVQIQFKNGNQFTRAYVVEFYQVHQGHIDDLRAAIDYKS